MYECRLSDLYKLFCETHFKNIPKCYNIFVYMTQSILIINITIEIAILV